MSGRRDKSRNWTPEEDAQIERMFVVEGLSALQIGVRLGKTKNQVSGRLDRLGITRGEPKFDWNEERVRELEAMHRQGLRCPAMAKRLGVGVVALRAKLHRMGLTNQVGDNQIRGLRVKGGILKPKTAPVVITKPLPEVKTPSDSGYGFTLAEREDSGCRDVTGYSRLRGPLYCGVVREPKSSWCRYHRALYCIPVRQKGR